jgi:hypothetical protein
MPRMVGSVSNNKMLLSMFKGGFTLFTILGLLFLLSNWLSIQISFKSTEKCKPSFQGYFLLIDYQIFLCVTL